MPRQVDHEQRRGEMAEALWRIAAHEGLEAVSLNRVADEAGVSKGRVQHYFPSRDALLEFTATHLQGRVSARLRARLGASTGLAAVRAALLEVMPLEEESRVDTRVGFAYLIRSLGDPRLRAYYRERNGLFLAMTTRFLTQAQEAGEVAPGRDPAHDAVVLFALANGLKEPLLVGDLTPEAAVAVVDDALAALG